MLKTPIYIVNYAGISPGLDSLLIMLEHLSTVIKVVNYSVFSDKKAVLDGLYLFDFTTHENFLMLDFARYYHKSLLSAALVNHNDYFLQHLVLEAGFLYLILLPTDMALLKDTIYTILGNEDNEKVGLVHGLH